MIQKVTLVWCCRTECKNWSYNEFLVDIRMRTAEIVKNLVKRCWSRLSILYSREAKCVKIARRGAAKRHCLISHKCFTEKFKGLILMSGCSEMLWPSRLEDSVNTQVGFLVIGARGHFVLIKFVK